MNTGPKKKLRITWLKYLAERILETPSTSPLALVRAIPEMSLRFDSEGWSVYVHPGYEHFKGVAGIYMRGFPSATRAVDAFTQEVARLLRGPAPKPKPLPPIERFGFSVGSIVTWDETVRTIAGTKFHYEMTGKVAKVASPQHALVEYQVGKRTRLRRVEYGKLRTPEFVFLRKELA